jgi:hypothetical protein
MSLTGTPRTGVPPKGWLSRVYDVEARVLSAKNFLMITLRSTLTTGRCGVKQKTTSKTFFYDRLPKST